jgi:D-beta-D-heptose 7-phosphate kinase/D-beta-D-heptose 1-phosphate adenosyltransferase
MKAVQSIPNKIYKTDELIKEVTRLRLKNKKIVFSNGVFDILHKGHIASLSQAAAAGDVLIIAVNSDASVKRLKGPERPINDENARALLLASLVMTDAIVIFEEDTPLELIKKIMPDVLVKGGDYRIENIAGAKEVIDNGGKVVLADMVEGISTSLIIERMKNS